jgi:muramoyltetrapeptide carboxypeptidase
MEDLAIVAEWMHSRGVDVVAPEDMLCRDLFCSNTDERRHHFLYEALSNPTVDAVWALCGGYGAAKLLPLLRSEKMPDGPKVFVGLSDATAVHLFLNQEWNWTSLHAFSAIRVLDPLTDLDCLEETFRQLSSPDLSCPIVVIPMNRPALALSTLSGRIVGGNLSLIQCGMGTFWQVKGRDKILLMEDVRLRAYQVDRILNHLEQVGVFHNLIAILFGDFLHCEEPNGTSLVDVVLERFAERSEFPVFRIPSVGHGHRCLPLWLNRDISLTVGQ